VIILERVIACNLQKQLKLKGENMTTIIIELDFESDDVHESDVINYLNELIEQDCLGWEVRK